MHYLFDKAWPSSQDSFSSVICVCWITHHELCFSLNDLNYPKKVQGAQIFFVPCSAHTDEFIHVTTVQTYNIRASE